MRLQENRLFLLQNLRFDGNRRLEAAERETRAILFSFLRLCRGGMRRCRSGFQGCAAAPGEFQVRKLTHELLRVAQRNRRLLDGLCGAGRQPILVVRFFNPQHNFVDSFRGLRGT